MTIFALAVGLVLAGVSFGLYRRLAVATVLPVAARRAVALVLGLGWVASVLGFAASGGAIDPSPIRPLVWVGMSGSPSASTWSSACWPSGPFVSQHDWCEVGDLRLLILWAGTPSWCSPPWASPRRGCLAAAPHITSVTITNDQVPEAFDGLRVALITDLHVGPVRDARFTQMVVDRVNAMQPDLVVLGADLADGKVEQVADTLAPLAQLTAPDGVVAVSGNHEFISGEADGVDGALGDAGITPLRNQHVARTRRGVSITVAGINDLSGRGADATDIDAALAGTVPAGFTMLVAHQPRAALGAQGRGVDLQLSGHAQAAGCSGPFRYAVLLQRAGHRRDWRRSATSQSLTGAAARAPGARRCGSAPRPEDPRAHHPAARLTPPRSRQCSMPPSRLSGIRTCAGRLGSPPLPACGVL